MASVVQSGGTAAGAGLPPDVFGKTGTAEFGNANPPETHAWFIGYRGNVAFAVIVEGGGVGGRVAAPLAAKFLDALASEVLAGPTLSGPCFGHDAMGSGMRVDGSIWPVKMPALKPASASSCVPVTYDERGLFRNSSGHACSSGRVATPERLREVRHEVLADGLLEVRHHRRVGRAGVEAVDADPCGASVNDRTAV